MKAQRPLLSAIFFIYISIFLLFFNCTSDVEFQTAEIQPPLTDVLTLELSFGDEKTIDKDEFLLVKPRYTVTGGMGNMYILDEDRIKVYDEKGIPKAIIGRPGKGPGEFENPRNPVVSEDGLLTVIDNKGANLFSAEFNYLTTHYIKYNTKYDELLDKNGWKLMELDKAIFITEDERIIATQTLPLEPEDY
ncbi:hypothetical protein AMJ80_04135 [bacterium SM23_31]|nr:MAG: hypothetical protein AMJ80_04135 [bacterium SM23_31]